MELDLNSCFRELTSAASSVTCKIFRGEKKQTCGERGGLFLFPSFHGVNLFNVCNVGNIIPTMFPVEMNVLQWYLNEQQ